MKVVLALAIVCLFQISLAAEDIDNSEKDLLLQRDVRESAGDCKKGESKKECRRRLRTERKKERKRQRKRTKAARKFSRKQKVDKPEKKKKKKNIKTGENPKKQQEKPGQSQETAVGIAQRNAGRQDTCFTDLVAKTKKFNKAQVEFRLANRIESWGKLMKNKKNNSASTFSDALEAMNEATGNGTGCEGDSSSLAETKAVREKLANCSVSAGANCDEGNLAIAIDATKVSTCKDTLETFAKDFKKCLTGNDSAATCSCVQGLTNPSDDCLNFKDMHDGVKAQKEKCTKGSAEGSFGDCRKQERMAAKFGNKCKKACPGGGGGDTMTTSTPARSQRMNLLRRLNQKIFN